MALRDFFYRLKLGTEYLNYGSHIILEWSSQYISSEKSDKSVSILDIGCGRCRDMLNIKSAFPGADIKLCGIDSLPDHCRWGEEHGVGMYDVDIERSPLPFSDGEFDIVIINNVMEHLKEIFWVTGEISRVLKPHGRMIIGVPNMAALHNRLLLVFGRQPACMETLGPHVRGFTSRSLKKFLQTENYFKILDFQGSNFYPFPPWASMPLSRLFPDLSVSIFLLAERTEKPGSFTDVLSRMEFETPYFKGEKTG